ncbi:PTS mannose transporter subunit IIA [Enterococcus sp. JM4C]|uniref:PTS sugar transporter subunit IIA n=1 Tax=Candidatus Enterococcus huntleyi TaxID=1857217 RepID=UPI00137A025B|nr:PTS sugar transporter subunit IIA [Enterococcus sp. JM4C]KAF1299440.1 PTS mannose transporter subunit IIA [Enterococcus sp. JM4C]
MDRKLVLASHGKFASGILSSLQLICGATDEITTLDCYLTEEFDLHAAVAEIIEANVDKEVVVVTDLFGGSVNNEFLTYIQRPNYYLVAGMNLPFLIELVTGLNQAKSLPEFIQQTLETSKQSIQFCNQTFQQEVDEEDF